MCLNQIDLLYRLLSNFYENKLIQLFLIPPHILQQRGGGTKESNYLSAVNPQNSRFSYPHIINPSSLSVLTSMSLSVSNTTTVIVGDSQHSVITRKRENVERNIVVHLSISKVKRMFYLLHLTI